MFRWVLEQVNVNAETEGLKTWYALWGRNKKIKC